MEKSWLEENTLEEGQIRRLFGPRFKESSINRVIYHGRDGFIIISTIRSKIVPINKDKTYNYDSWQSLFDEYVDYCKGNNLPIFQNNVSKEKGTKGGYNFDELSEKEFLKQQNERCDQEFWKYLNSKENAYNFTPSWIGYISKDKQEASTKEPSFIVYNSINKYKKKPGSWEDLKAKALEWCERYKQDCVYIQSPNEAPVYVNKDGEVVSLMSSLDFGFNRDNSYYTSVGRKLKHSSKNIPKEELMQDKPDIPHTFTADIELPESRQLLSTMRIRAHEPAYLIEMMKWSQLGEIWHLEDLEYC